MTALSTSSKQYRKLRVAAVACLLAGLRLDALTLTDLLADTKLTPKRFAAHFEDFEYEYGPEVLPAEVFLERRRGDCDDYAVLAGFVLKRKGYAARLIHVRMVGRVAHAVCYVTQGGVYLDFNNRKYFLNLKRCGRTIREIASQVADSFEANWTSALEFTFDYREDKKHFGATVVKTDPPASDPDSARNTTDNTKSKS